ncbi:MAG: biotin--[acetyl-CoA-carboxylase] ligase [Thermoanaerobaculia bacterium]
MDFPEYARAIASRHRRNFIAVQQTASTHLLARRIVEEYGRESLRAPAADVVAWTQTAGVGRDRRKWSSPPGKGVYLTAIRSLESTDRIQLLPLAISVSLCETVDRWLRPPDAAGVGDPGSEGVCRLKWPNDLYAEDRKLGGILIDVVSPGGEPPDAGSPAAEPTKPLASLSSQAAARETRKPIAILSVGVNISSDLAAFEQSRATSVAVEAERRGRAVISLAEAAAELIGAIDAGLGSGPAKLIEAYHRLSVHRPGERMRCHLKSGAVTGTFLGFDRQGFLRLRVAGEEKRISSGVIADG